MGNKARLIKLNGLVGLPAGLLRPTTEAVSFGEPSWVGRPSRYAARWIHNSVCVRAKGSRVVIVCRRGPVQHAKFSIRLIKRKTQKLYLAAVPVHASVALVATEQSRGPGCNSTGGNKRTRSPQRACSHSTVRGQRRTRALVVAAEARAAALLVGAQTDRASASNDSHL